MKNMLLLGDEAVGLGAMHAGISGVFSYPGTPATEIFEYIEGHPEAGYVVAYWSANEKVAYEEALGMSFAGKRALVSMKHVGLNVAADPFMSSALTGAHGGLVLAVADDPSMHSSQNEQDSRYYGHFAKIPVFEPATQQQAYDMTREAFEVSEKFHIPAMVRLVTRLAHSRSSVVTQPRTEPTALGKAPDWRNWTLLPLNARKRYDHLLKLQAPLEAYSHASGHDSIELRDHRGIICSGIAQNYVAEALKDDSTYSILRIGAYPLPKELFEKLLQHCDEILIVEEGYPFIEQQLNGLLGIENKTIRGKTNGALPASGELSVDAVRVALGAKVVESRAPQEDLPTRPPRLCDGCPHCDTFRAIMEAVGTGPRPYLFSDIGCYTLGALEPYNAIDTCVDMGASISMGIGAAKAGAHPVICTIGDSTFVHSGTAALIGAAQINANMTVIILDNATVAMTGGQQVFATGDDLIRIVHGLGVDPAHVIKIEPLPKNHGKNTEIFLKEVNHRGLSVILACRPCIQLKRKLKKHKQTTAQTTPQLAGTDIDA